MNTPKQNVTQAGQTIMQPKHQKLHNKPTQSYPRTQTTGVRKLQALPNKLTSTTQAHRQSTEDQPRNTPNKPITNHNNHIIANQTVPENLQTSAQIQHTYKPRTQTNNVRTIKNVIINQT